jgi:hypothetical protein
VAIYTRKAGGKAAADDPDLAALPADQKKAIQGMMARFNSETDAGKLRSALSKLEAQGDKAPPEAKAFGEVLRKKLKERIAELEKSAK